MIINFQNITNNGLFIELLSQCNLKCIHCFNSANDKKYILDKNIILRTFDEFVNSGGKTLSLSGGEPLLHPNFMDIVEHASNIFSKVLVLTNGLLLDSYILEKLTPLDNVFLQLSLDGINKATYETIRGNKTFEYFTKVVHTLKSYICKERISFFCVLSKINYPQISEIINYSLDNGSKISFSCLNKIGRAKSNFDELSLDKSEKLNIWNLANFEYKYNNNIIFLIHSNNCHLLQGIPFPVVSSNGNVYPCLKLYSNNFSLGNIHKDSIIKILINDRFKKLVEFLRNSFEFNESCSLCNINKICPKGCPADALLNYKDILHSDGLCEIRYNEVLKNIITKAYTL